MGINLTSNFSPKTPQFLDERQSFATLEEMKNYDTSNLPEGFITYVGEKRRRYMYHSDNADDKNLGKWRAYSLTGGASIMNDLTIQMGVGFIEPGTTYPAGTLIEDIIRDIFCLHLSDDLSYWGVTNGKIEGEPTVEIIKSLNSANIGNRRLEFLEKDVVLGNLIYAYPTSYGELTSIKGNGLEYINGTFIKTTLIIDDVEYYVYYLKDAAGVGEDGILWVMM